MDKISAATLQQDNKKGPPLSSVSKELEACCQKLEMAEAMELEG